MFRRDEYEQDAFPVRPNVSDIEHFSAVRRQYLRAREVLHTRAAHPRPEVAIEARHVATVFRELAGNGGSRSVPTPATPTRLPSFKRVVEAAVAVANGEAGATNRLGVTAPQRVSGGPQQTPGRAAGQHPVQALRRSAGDRGADPSAVLRPTERTTQRRPEE